jgi:hypothetical protein
MDAFVMPSLMALPAVPIKAMQVRMPMSMKAKLSTSATSQVRRFSSAGGKGFRKNGSGVSGPDTARSVVTVIPTCC